MNRGLFGCQMGTEMSHLLAGWFVCLFIGSPGGRFVSLLAGELACLLACSLGVR